MRPRRLLDVGAGSGGPTAALAPLFDDVMTTEAAGYMVTQLRERGFKYAFNGHASMGICFPEADVRCIETCDLLAEPLLQGQLFDVVAIFNVLDRCMQPFSLVCLEMPCTVIYPLLALCCETFSTAFYWHSPSCGCITLPSRSGGSRWRQPLPASRPTRENRGREI